MQIKQLYHREPASNILDVILHGSSGGIDHPFIQKLYQNSIALHHNVIAFNFPYLDRGEDHSSGPELTEEIQTLVDILALYRTPVIDHINLIGKSLGGLVANNYLCRQNPSDQLRFSIFILGFLTNDIDLSKLLAVLVVIQGEKDKYGSPAAVEDKIRKNNLANIKVFAVPGADHSYRNDLKEPVYEDQVIEILKTALS